MPAYNDRIQFEREPTIGYKRKHIIKQKVKTIKIKYIENIIKHHMYNI